MTLAGRIQRGVPINRGAPFVASDERAHRAVAAGAGVVECSK